jgi:hypothetical protein
VFAQVEEHAWTSSQSPMELSHAGATKGDNIKRSRNPVRKDTAELRQRVLA